MSVQHRCFHRYAPWLAAPLALSLTSMLACGEAHPQHRGAEFQFGPAPAKGQPIHRPTGAKPDIAPGVRDDGSIVYAVDWFEGSFEQALAAAKAQGKLVFVDVGAYWCPPCHELDEKVFVRPEVGDWLRERTIALHIDAEKGDGPELVERYHVQAYPTMLVLEAGGLEKGRIVDFVEAEALLEQLEALATGGNVLAELEAAVAAEPDNLEARFRLGHAYTLAARRDDAEQLFIGVVAADPENTTGLASKVFYDNSLFFTLKLDNDPEAAIAELEALQRKYPDSREATTAYRVIGRAHCKLGRPEQAVAALEAMVASDPANVDLKASFGWFSFRESCRPDAGLAAVLAGIEQDPESAELRYLEAELRRLLGEPAAALAAIRKAGELEPESAYYKRQIRRFEALAEGKPG
jgi:tetratricopeptide (TPR) repeat protein